MTRRGIAVLVGSVLLALLGSSLIATPAQAATYDIARWDNKGKCLDAATERAKLSMVQIWNCNHKFQQAWAQINVGVDEHGISILEFRNVLFGTCLTKNETNPRVDVQPCLRDVNIPNPAQQWRVYYAFNPSSGGWFQQLQNMNDGRCLEASDLSNGAPLGTWTCDPTHANRDQRWSILTST